MSSVLDVGVRYDGFDLVVNVTWDQPSIVLFGRSGCGKSTLVEAIAGLRPEVGGRITIGGRTLQDGTMTLPPQRRNVGWVPQDGSLFPHMTVSKNIAFGASRAGRRDVAARAIEVLELGSLLDRDVAALSGGERQRVAVARALASGAELLLLDEPLAALDLRLRTRILAYLVKAVQELNVPLVYVSHDPAEARALGAEVVVLSDGHVVAQGSPDTVFGAAPVLGVLEALGVHNRFTVAQIGTEDRLVRVRTDGGAELLMSPPAAGSQHARIAVRAEDLLLSRARLVGTSARNQLQGQVVAVTEVEHRVFVTIAVGSDRWVALVTAAAVAELGLKVGGDVWIVLKTSAIHADSIEA